MPLKNPYTRILGHPNRTIIAEEKMAVDLDLNELVALAAEHNTAIEINANPRRLDLDWRFGNKARENRTYDIHQPRCPTLPMALMIFPTASALPEKVSTGKTVC